MYSKCSFRTRYLFIQNSALCLAIFLKNKGRHVHQEGNGAYANACHVHQVTLDYLPVMPVSISINSCGGTKRAPFIIENMKKGCNFYLQVFYLLNKAN